MTDKKSHISKGNGMTGKDKVAVTVRNDDRDDKQGRHGTWDKRRSREKI